MSLFKKNKNKNNEDYINESEELTLAENDEKKDVKAGGLADLFSSPAEEDVAHVDGTDDELSSILDKYIDESFAEDKPADTPEMSGDLMSEGVDLSLDLDSLMLDMPASEGTLDELGDILSESAEHPAAQKDAVETVLPDLTDVTSEPPADDIYAILDLAEDTSAENVAEEDVPDKELTADEAIEEFMKNVSLGGSIADILGETDSVAEDGLEIPVFVAGNESETAEIDDVLPVETEPPVDIDSMDFNTAETDAVGSTDMNLRIAFGLEEEVDDSEEVKDAVKKMGDHFESDRRVHKKYQPDHPEYTDTTQARDIAGEYKTRRRNVGIRLALSAVFAILLILFENITTITDLITGSPKQFAGIFDPAVYPVVYVMVSLQLLLLSAVCALPELRRGFKRLFTGAPTPESISAFVLFVAVVASGVTAYQANVNEVPAVYNAVAAVSMVMALVYSRLNVKRELITFFIAGSKKKKYAMNRVPENETLLSPESYEEDMYGDVMRVERTGFVDGFFSRMCVPDGMTGAFSAGLIGVAVAAAILFGIFAADSNVASVCRTAYITVLALLPFSAYVAFSYPFYRAAKAASECESAIIGETSLEEYAATAVVSFDDGNVFPSFGVKVQNIRIYNNARIDRVLYYASSAFKYAGGPLADVFEVATMEMGRSEDVQITDADKGYLAASVDGVGIVFGSYPSLVERGFDISDAVALDDVDFSDELSIMYMFREGMLIAKLYIKYVLDGDIEPILRQFQDYGMYLCVRTYDPNIDEDMICSKLSIKNPPVKVVRYRNTDDARGVVERVDSGFVTYGSPKSLLQLLPYCDKTIHTKRTCGALTVMSVIFALMLLAISSMSAAFGSLNSLYVIMYHIVWMLFTYLAAKIFIR